MKYFFPILLFISPLQSSAQEPAYDVQFFVNSRMSGSYFYGFTFQTAPSSITHINDKLPVSEKEFFTPGNSLQLQYVNGEGGKWSAVLVRQEIRGQDHIRSARALSFKILVDEAATPAAQLPVVQFGYNDSTFTESIPIAEYIHPIRDSKWKNVYIPLSAFRKATGRSQRDIRAVLFLQNGTDKKKHEIFVDDVELAQGLDIPEVKTKPFLLHAKGYARHVDIEWGLNFDTAAKYIKIYRSEDNKNFIPVGIQLPQFLRYADYTGVTGKKYYYKASFLDRGYRETALSDFSSSATTRPMSDDELLTMVQEANFRYYWEQGDRASGLTRENIPGRRNMIAIGASGFGMMALIAGAERKFIPSEMLIPRFTQMVDFLDTAETHHGVYPHFMDGPTAKTEPFFGSRDNGGDLVETSFLVQGLLTARAYFSGDNRNEKYIRDKITKIWQRIEWDWYRRTPNSKYLFWHWSPDQAWVIDHKLIGWNETMVTYLLAIASPTHGVPGSMYYSGWASQDKEARDYRKGWGQSGDGMMYTNGKTYHGIKLDVGVNKGGPLFFVHYSFLGYDPHKITDKYTNYFDNNRNIALINYRYCVENPGGFKGYGDSCWGLTAADGPWSYSASEPVPWQDDGKMAPTGALASFPYTPEESMKALKNYYYNYGKFLWGEFGFRDAFNLSQNWCSEIYMGLNQAPVTVMIENYRTGLIWKLFMSDPDVQNGLKKIK
jgi:exo beta-1,2-glucooligosaccharide sophorohydrolase (non-reducing end)